MGEHFRLDVDVSALRRAQRQMVRHAETLGEGERVLRRAPDRWKQGWTGDASDFMAGQARELASDTRGFVRRLEAAEGAVKAFADRLDEALDRELPDLNRRWEEAARVHDAAVKAADRQRTRSMDNLPEGTTGQERQQARRETDEIRSSAVSVAWGVHAAAKEKLEGEYDDLVNDLTRAARTMSRRLQESVPLPIKADEAGPFTARGLAQHPMGKLPSDDLLRRLRDQAEKEYGGPAHDLLLELTKPSNDLAEVTEMLERARGLGLHPRQFKETLDQYWFLDAAADAGIDMSTWDPSKGAEFNRETIMKVYRYYGDLYLENSDLQWAGMANMIGPSFAGGFLDLGMVRSWAQAVDRMGASPFGPVTPGAMIDVVATMTDEELKFYETTLLSMQKNIFFDQGRTHQAYNEGGIAAMLELYEAGAIPKDVYDAWVGLDSGDTQRVSDANVEFLRREQEVVIKEDYLRMYNRPLTGQAMTWVMTQIGKPSIPGAKSFAELYPVQVAADTGPINKVRIPGTPITLDNPLVVTVHVDTPFADGNVALFEDRWRLIKEDTLPAYQKLLSEDPDLARSLIAADVPERVEQYRLKNTLDDILEHLRDGWEIDRIEQ